MKIKLSLLILILASYTITGCNSSEYLSAYSSIQSDSLKQINDEDIQKALEAQPQITLPTSIAIYNASRDKFPFQDSILTLEQIQRAVEVSPALLNPGSYYQSQYTSSYHNYYQTPAPLNLKKLRLYAAQAKTDLVLFVSSSSHFEEQGNILSPLYAGLITIPFIPGQRVQLTTYLEAYIIDVRNGLLYSSYRDKKVFDKRFAKVSFSRKIDRYKLQHIEDMMPEFIGYIETTITNPALHLQHASMTQ